MAYCVEVPRSRQGLRVSVLTLIAVGFAGCSADVTRFGDAPFSSPYASRNAPASSEVTGSISRGPAAPASKVESRPLPQTQAAALPPPPPKNPSATGSAAGAGGMASYRPPQTSGSAPSALTGMAAPQPQAGRVTVAPGDTLAVLSRRHGVSIAALIKANGLAAPNDLKIGQQIVIPGHGSAPPTAASPTQAPATVPAASSFGGFHIAGPGDTLNKIARRYRVSLTDLAKANKVASHTQIKLGDRLAIPAQTSAKPVVAPPADAIPQRPAPQTTAPAQQVAATEPPHTANVASPTVSPEAEAKRETGGAVFRWPVRGRIVTAFGAKPNGQQNDGINIAVPEGTPIKAAEDGEVAYAGNELKGYGNLILVRHPNGFVTAYAHVSELMVKRGDKVKRGQVIAKSGRTGSITSPQLHFEIRKGSMPVDPTPYLGA
ncbi:MAG: peptidoglycan DD-metalloendopeptidase family protein [Rhizobiales bacterium]|nr:peptidoglycan DD-metalloendopeptidase family protein [Hyphomicrobiales bacterium]